MGGWKPRKSLASPPDGLSRPPAEALFGLRRPSDARFTGLPAPLRGSKACPRREMLDLELKKALNARNFPNT
jgi:hypothetical protein